MKTIDIFYQAEGLREIAHLECGADENYTALKEAIGNKHGLGNDAFIFLEDADEPVDLKEATLKPDAKGGIKVHVHRCREVKVSVTFNGETVNHPFTPATTIAKVKKWAAERKFGMTDEEAGEHVLQIKGTHERPAPNIHIGTLVAHPHCHIAFDLVPDERVNGASGQEG
jgi:hypothetical protein